MTSNLFASTSASFQRVPSSSPPSSSPAEDKSPCVSVPIPPIDLCLQTPGSSSALTPFLRTAPLSARSKSRLYQGFDSSEETQSNDEKDKGHDYEKERWADPGRSFGKRTIGLVLLAGASLLMMFVFLGRASDGLDSADGPLVHEPGLEATPGDTEDTEAKGFNVFSPATISSKFPYLPQNFSNQCDSIGGLEISPDDYWGVSKEAQKVDGGRKYSSKTPDGQDICESTLTYLLDGEHGFMFHVNALLMAAALAKDSGRAFFVVDANWDRGRLTDYFAPLPDPKCAPPPPSEMYACPRASRHLLLSSLTLHHHINTPAFMQRFTDTEALKQWSQKPLLERLQPVAAELLVPSLQVEQVLIKVQEELRSTSPASKENVEGEGNIAKSDNGEGVWAGWRNGTMLKYIGVHVRRGDRHPFEKEFFAGYIPPERYIETIATTWLRLRKTDGELPEFPNVYLASDSILVVESIIALAPPQWRFFHLSLSNSQAIKDMASPHEYSQPHFKAHSFAERRTYTRGLMVDMAFLAGGWGLYNGMGVVPFVGQDESSEKSKDRHIVGFDRPLATICTISSNVCRFAAVQTGWTRSFPERRWINIDDKDNQIWSPVEVPPPKGAPRAAKGQHSGRGQRIPLRLL